MELELRRVARPRRMRRATSFASMSASCGPVMQLAAAKTPAKGAVGSERPSLNRLLLRNPAALVSLVPKEAYMFIAGGIAGAIAKSTTAPLDRARRPRL